MTLSQAGEQYVFHMRRKKKVELLAELGQMFDDYSDLRQENLEQKGHLFRLQALADSRVVRAPDFLEWSIVGSLRKLVKQQRAELLSLKAIQAAASRVEEVEEENGGR